MNALAHRITGVTRAPWRTVVVPRVTSVPVRVPWLMPVPRPARVLVVALAGTAGVMVVLERVVARVG